MIQPFFIKTLFLFFFVSIFLSFACTKTYAQDDFYVDSDSTYKVFENAQTTVTQHITITNRKEFVYSPSYSVTVHIKNLQNINAQDGNGAIPFTQKDDESSKTINLNFPNKILGVGQKNSFTFSYTTSNLAKKSGDIWHVTIPGVSNPDEFNAYSVNLSVPPGFGKPSIIKPPLPYDSTHNTYTFSKSALSTGGVELFFGSPQVYKFNVSYHLENKNPFPVTTEIALPPNTNYQEVLINSIFPNSASVYQDTDGNWLARFSLGPKSSYTVHATLLIKVSNIPDEQPITDQEKILYTKSLKYWEASDPEIQKIAKTQTTPQEIYNYVVKTLSYSSGKTDKNNTRLGAKKVLSEPYFAVCLEFTDLFVALARANGIPARAVEGYGYTEGESNKPLSLVTDTLHAWPEYYDTTQKTWIMVDPTWGNTTQGVDFFHQLDFDHVAFVINGKDSLYPIPAGGYKGNTNTKDVDVSFVSVDEFIEQKKVIASATFSPFLNGDAISGQIRIENKGNSLLSSYQVQVFVNGKKPTNVSFSEIPPGGADSVSVLLQTPQAGNFLAALTNPSYAVTITDRNGKQLYKKSIEAFPFSIFILIGGAVFLAAGIVFFIAIKTRSVPVQRQ